MGRTTELQRDSSLAARGKLHKMVKSGWDYDQLWRAAPESHCSVTQRPAPNAAHYFTPANTNAGAPATIPAM